MCCHLSINITGNDEKIASQPKHFGWSLAKTQSTAHISTIGCVGNVWQVRVLIFTERVCHTDDS